MQRGRIVDGLGGSSGPIGLRASGALDGEVAFLAGAVSKEMLFSGGVDAVAGTPGATADALARPGTAAGRLAWQAYVEGAVKAVASLAVSAPAASTVILSGRLALVDGVREELATRLQAVMIGVSVSVLTGFASTAKQAAQGAALIADGLAGGRSAPLVAALRLREARGTALDYLWVIPAAAARLRLGLDLPGA